MKTCTVFFLLCASTATQAQNFFTLGAKVAYGTSAFPTDGLLQSDGTTTVVKSGATLSTGILGRYTISNRIGIESGISFNHYSFYDKTQFRTRDAIWKSAATLEVVNYQVPILVNVKVQARSRPFHYFIFGAGTSLDWLLPYWHSGVSWSLLPESFQNVIGSLKTGRDSVKGNSLEFGFDVQYSLKQFHFSNVNYSPIQRGLSARLNMISLSLAYFFLK